MTVPQNLITLNFNFQWSLENWLSFLSFSALFFIFLQLSKHHIHQHICSQDKLAPIPEKPKEKNTPHVPDFVRNVMGSSAGAGSGEFHVYRHLRRKEYARQKFIQEKGEKVCMSNAVSNTCLSRHFILVMILKCFDSWSFMFL